MVKVLFNGGPDPFKETPCLIAEHVSAEFSGMPFDFHVLAYWIVPYQFPFWPISVVCGYDYDNQPEFYTLTDTMVGMAQLMFANPALLSDMCPYCNQRFGVPRHPRFNIIRGGQYPYHVSVCAWDPDNQFAWTPPDQPMAWLDGPV